MESKDGCSLAYSVLLVAAKQPQHSSRHTCHSHVPPCTLQRELEAQRAKLEGQLAAAKQQAESQVLAAKQQAQLAQQAAEAAKQQATDAEEAAAAAAAAGSAGPYPPKVRNSPRPEEFSALLARVASLCSAGPGSMYARFHGAHMLQWDLN